MGKPLFLNRGQSTRTQPPSRNPKQNEIPIDWIQDAGITIKIQPCQVKPAIKDCEIPGKPNGRQEPGGRFACKAGAQNISVKKARRLAS
jgi:hypothetical protein